MNARPIEIIYVEDDSVTRKIIISALENKGVIVRSAKNGQEAYEMCVAKKPDMILSDWYMPEMDGVELLGKIRSHPELASIYFIMLTAQHEQNQVAEVLTLGADDYVTKPVSMQELVARIRTGFRVTSLLHEVKEQHTKTLQMERLKVMLESTGAASHHLSQPLTAMILSLEMMLEENETFSAHQLNSLEECLNLSRWMQEIVQKFQRIEEYKTEPYYYDSHILDIGLDQNIDQWLSHQAARTVKSTVQ